MNSALSTALEWCGVAGGSKLRELRTAEVWEMPEISESQKGLEAIISGKSCLDNAALVNKPTLGRRPDWMSDTQDSTPLNGKESVTPDAPTSRPSRSFFL